MRGMLSAVLVASALILTACGGDDVEGDLSGQPVAGNVNFSPDGDAQAGGGGAEDDTAFVARFDPSNSVVPFPTDLLFSGTADGTLNIPLAGDSSDAVTSALNALDGFSTVAPITTTFSEAVDPASITPASVRVFKVATDPTNKRVTSVIAELSMATSTTPDPDFLAALSSTDAEAKTLAVVPLKPLEPTTTYLVALSNGIKNLDGESLAADNAYLLARSTVPLFRDGASVIPGLNDESAEALDASLRPVVNAQAAALLNAGVDVRSIVMSWSFSTQSVGEVLEEARELAQAADVTTAAFVPLGNTSQLTAGAAAGLADLYQGSLSGLPYYLTNNDSASASPDPLTRFWQGAAGSNLTGVFPDTTDQPVATSTETIPVLISVPNGNSGNTKPDAGWPVVIYQHGITADRATLLGLADALAAAGFVAVAIDLPLHGITNTTFDDRTSSAGASTALYNVFHTDNERTFELDVVNNVTGVPGPDGNVDDSGDHYINLSSLLTTRDNLRQSSADLFALVKALPTIDYDGDEASDLDTAQIRFVGHSMGAIVGIPFLALEPDVGAAVLAMPGGGLAKLLDGSRAFSPRLIAGLFLTESDGTFTENQDRLKGTAGYEQFLIAAQTAVDSGDPINYAAAAVTGPEPGVTDRAVLMLEVIGNGSTVPADLVVPNNVGTLAAGFTDVPVSDFTAITLPNGATLSQATGVDSVATVAGPLAGTDPLAAVMGLDTFSSTPTPAGSAFTALLRFTAGHHSSIATPNETSINDEPLDDPNAGLVFDVMQNAMANFVASNGLSLVVSTSASSGIPAAAAQTIVEQP